MRGKGQGARGKGQGAKGRVIFILVQMRISWFLSRKNLTITSVSMFVLWRAIIDNYYKNEISH